MDEEMSNLVFGVIFLILLINTTMLASIVSSLNGSPQSMPLTNSSAQIVTLPETPTQVMPTPGVAEPAPTVLPLANQAVIPPPGVTETVPTISPLTNTGAPLADTVVVVQNPPDNPANGLPSSQVVSPYVTVEAREAPPIESHPFTEPMVPQRYEEGYVTIYSLINQRITQNLPYVSFTLYNPPLVLDYNITPLNSVDIKYMEYKEVSTTHRENLVINRPFEDAWFVVVVRNKDTGQIVAEDGFGRTYSFQAPRQIVLRESGNYSFEFTGDYGNLDLTMKVKEEGNFP